MLYRDGIVAGLQGGKRVIPGSVRASHEMRVALDVRYCDFRVGNDGTRRIQNNACDAARSNLRKAAGSRKNEHHNADEDAEKGSIADGLLVLMHGSPLCWIGKLKLEKNSPLIQPVAQIPHHQQDRGCLRDRRQRSNKAEMECEHPNGTVQPSVQDFTYEINKNGIHPDDEKRKTPFAVSQYLDNQVKPDQHKQHPAQAVQNKTCCAKLLDE